MTPVQSIEFIVGTLFLILGLSYIFCNKVWRAWLELLEEAPHRAALPIGGINLFLGLFVLAYHWIWQGPQTVVTVLGVLMTVKGMIHLLFPCILPFRLGVLARAPAAFFVIGGLIISVLGAYVLSDWVEQPGVKNYWEKSFLLAPKKPGKAKKGV